MTDRILHDGSETPAPPEALIGQRVNIDSNRHGKSGAGVVEAVRYPIGVITKADTGLSFKCVQFKVRRDNGGYFWTLSMPDASKPVS